MPLIVLLLTFASCSLGPEAEQPAPTPTATPKLDMTLEKYDPGLPADARNAPVIGQVPDSQILHINVAFKLDQKALDQLGKDSKSSEDSTKSATEVANTLGINQEVVKKVQAYFGIQDATVKVGQLRTDLAVDIKAGGAAKLLKTKFLFHQLKGRQFYAPDPQQPVMLPKFVLDNTVAITGLSNYSIPPTKHSAFSTQALQTSQQVQKPAATCLRKGANPGLVDAQALAHAYGYDQYWNRKYHGEKQTINIMTYEGFDQNDINNYFACVGFNGTLKSINVTADAPPPGGETTLDIEMIAGMAPHANIRVYMLDQDKADPSTATQDILQRIIDDNADNKSGGVLSYSWGSPEDEMPASIIAAIHQRFQLLAQVEHITTFTASGDCGAFDLGDYNALAVDYPASDPAVVGVGGTVLSMDQQDARVKEVVWSNGADHTLCKNHWGSGGGVSTRIEQPQWQNAAGVKNTYTHGMRQVPDVSAVAYMLPMYYNGEWRVAAGTSAAAPIWAAGWTLVNQALKTTRHIMVFSPTTLYWIANHPGKVKPFYDVVQGDNLYYKATPGWDQASGIGTPNLQFIYRVLIDNL